VGQLDTLGRPGGARGVDQGRHVTRFDQGARLVEVESTGGGRDDVVESHGAVLPGPVDHHDVLDGAAAERDRRPDDRQELSLGDDDPVVRIGKQVADLLGRGGVVHREGGGAQVLDGGVDDEELRPVEQHQPDVVAAAHPETGESPCDVGDPGAVLAPGQGLLLADRAQRDVVGEPGCRPGECLGQGERPVERQRLTAQRGPEQVRCCSDGRGHGHSLVEPIVK
jgi:hypothetical protein